MQVCVRCEAPFDDAATGAAGSADDIDLALPRPAAPSPTQSHGTVMLAVLSGFVVLAVLLWLSVRGVGPFEARVLETKPAGEKTAVTVEVSNKGTKAGHGKCRIERLSEFGDRGQDYQFLSLRVPPKGSITQTVDVDVRPGERTGNVEC
jgi:hypothetical protein